MVKPDWHHFDTKIIPERKERNGIEKDEKKKRNREIKRRVRKTERHIHK